MKNMNRMPILVIPGKGHVVLPPYGPGPVIPPGNNPNQPDVDMNFPPIPSKPEDNNMLITIKSVFVNKFIQVGVNSYLYARGEYFNDGTPFIMILLDRNQIKLRAQSGEFIRLDDRGFLIADTDNKGASIFNVSSVNKGEYVLMAPNGYYVTVRDEDYMLIARAENEGSRNIFKFRKI